MAPRILIAAGGTVGHVAPALAVADELRDRGAEVVFAGTPNRVEARLVPERGYPFMPFRVSGLDRSSAARFARAVGQGVAAPLACARIIHSVRPDVVLGGGGYVAGPMVAAAAARRVPTALTEADAHLGLANRLAAPLADRVLLAWPIKGCDGPRFRVVGRPVARAFFSVTREEGRAAFGLARTVPLIAIVGGSLGSVALNHAAMGAFGREETGLTIIHVTGRGKTDGVLSGPRYRIIEFSDRMPELLAAADLVIARAGGMVFELAAAGIPAILVPWAGAAADHQTRNAERFAEAGAAVVISDADLTSDRLRDEAIAILRDPRRQASMRAAMRSLARPHAVDDIADEVLGLVRSR